MFLCEAECQLRLEGSLDVQVQLRLRQTPHIRLDRWDRIRSTHAADFAVNFGSSYIGHHAVLRLVRGEARARDWLVYVLAALCVARFVYLT
jgi:hypothetical protein